MDSDLYRASTFGDGLVEVPNIQKDIRDAAVEDFEGIDAVLHLAALSNDPLGSIDRELTLSINYRGSVHVARLAKAAGVKRFVFSSSCSTYGAGGYDVWLIKTDAKQRGRVRSSRPRHEEVCVGGDPVVNCVSIRKIDKRIELKKDEQKKS